MCPDDSEKIFNVSRLFVVVFFFSSYMDMNCRLVLIRYTAAQCLISDSTPALVQRQTQVSYKSQYRRLLAYSYALKISFFHRTIPYWNGLPSYVVCAQSTESLRSLFRPLEQRTHASILLLVNI